MSPNLSLSQRLSALLVTRQTNKMRLKHASRLRWLVVALIGAAILLSNRFRSILPINSLRRKLEGMGYVLSRREVAKEPQCRAGNICDSPASYQRCRQLEDEGCSTIVRTLNCPPTYSCIGDPPLTPGEELVDLLKDYNGVVTPASCVLYYGFFCIASANEGVCQAIVDSGCQNVVQTLTCPQEFSCWDASDTPSALNPSNAPQLGGTNASPQPSATPLLPSIAESSIPTFMPATGLPLLPARKNAPPAKCGSIASRNGIGGAAAEAKGCGSRFLQTPHDRRRKPKGSRNHQLPQKTSGRKLEGVGYTVSSGGVPEESQCPEDNVCDSPASYQRCRRLEEDEGCPKIVRTLNCPPTYTCFGDPLPTGNGDDEDLLKGYDGVVTPASCILYYGSMCFTDKSTDECRALQSNGCETVVKTTRCPPEFSCWNSTIPSMLFFDSALQEGGRYATQQPDNVLLSGGTDAAQLPSAALSVPNTPASPIPTFLPTTTTSLPPTTTVPSVKSSSLASRNHVGIGVLLQFIAFCLSH